MDGSTVCGHLSASFECDSLGRDLPEVAVLSSSVLISSVVRVRLKVLLYSSFLVGFSLFLFLGPHNFEKT